MTTNTPGPIEVIREQAEYWRERAAMALDGMRKCERDYTAKSKSLTEAADLLGECLGLLGECQKMWEHPLRVTCAICKGVNRCKIDCRLAAAIAKGRAK